MNVAATALPSSFRRALRLGALLLMVAVPAWTANAQDDPTVSPASDLPVPVLPTLLSSSPGAGPDPLDAASAAHQSPAPSGDHPLLRRGPPSPGAHQGDPWLDRLEARMFPVPDCATHDSCAQVQDVAWSGPIEQPVVRITVHAQVRSAVPLPQITGAQWGPWTVDTGTSLPLRRGQDGAAWALVEPGISTLSAPLLNAGPAVTLAWANVPKGMSGHPTGWTVTGEPEWAPSIVRLARSSPEVGASGPTPAVPPVSTADVPLYLSVVRHVQADPSGIRATLVVERLSPADAAATTTVELMPGEHAIGDGVSQTGATLNVAFGAQETSQTFQTRFDNTGTLTLVAPAQDDRKETWTVDVSERLTPTLSGLPPLRDGATSGALTFLPFPGQSVRIALSVPRAAPGGWVAIDEAHLGSTVGPSATGHVLDLKLHASIAGTLRMDLPAAWRLNDAQINDQPAQKTWHDGHLALDILPGEQHVLLQFTGVGETPSMRTRAPALNLGAPTANLSWSVQLPNDRWVWWASGPLYHPMVLWWGVLVVVVLVAVGLSRVLRRPWQPSLGGWITLMVPLSTLSPLSVMIVVAFLLALEAKVRWSDRVDHDQWGLMQAGLLLLGGLSVLVLLAGIYHGLMGTPTMMVVSQDPTGNAATGLLWYNDRAPEGHWWHGSVFSAPVWAWRVVILLWALWLVRALVRRGRGLWSILVLGGAWHPKED